MPILRESLAARTRATAFEIQEVLYNLGPPPGWRPDRTSQTLLSPAIFEDGRIPAGSREFDIAALPSLSFGSLTTDSSENAWYNDGASDASSTNGDLVIEDPVIRQRMAVPRVNWHTHRHCNRCDPNDPTAFRQKVANDADKTLRPGYAEMRNYMMRHRGWSETDANLYAMGRQKHDRYAERIARAREAEELRDSVRWSTEQGRATLRARRNRLTAQDDGTPNQSTAPNAASRRELVIARTAEAALAAALLVGPLFSNTDGAAENNAVQTTTVPAQENNTVQTTTVPEPASMLAVPDGYGATFTADQLASFAAARAIRPSPAPAATAAAEGDNATVPGEQNNQLVPLSAEQTAMIMQLAMTHAAGMAAAFHRHRTAANVAAAEGENATVPGEESVAGAEGENATVPEEEDGAPEEESVAVPEEENGAPEEDNVAVPAEENAPEENGGAERA